MKTLNLRKGIFLLVFLVAVSQFWSSCRQRTPESSKGGLRRESSGIRLPFEIPDYEPQPPFMGKNSVVSYRNYLYSRMRFESAYVRYPRSIEELEEKGFLFWRPELESYTYEVQDDYHKTESYLEYVPRDINMEGGSVLKKGYYVRRIGGDMTKKQVYYRGPGPSEDIRTYVEKPFVANKIESLSALKRAEIRLHGSEEEYLDYLREHLLQDLVNLFTIYFIKEKGRFPEGLEEFKQYVGNPVEKNWVNQLTGLPLKNTKQWSPGDIYYGPSIFKGKKCWVFRLFDHGRKGSFTERRFYIPKRSSTGS